MKLSSASVRNITDESVSPSVLRGIIITFLFSIGLVMTRQALASHGLRIPGSSGIYWMALLLLNRHYGMGKGAGTVMGLVAGSTTWLFFSSAIGFGAGIGLVGKYFIAGFIVDLIYRKYESTWLTGVSWGGIGAAANALRFIVHAMVKTWTGTFSWALIFGKWNALGTHILFGFLGGVIAFGIVFASLSLREKLQYK